MECIHRGRKDTFLVAPYLSRSGKLMHLPFGLKKCADSVLLWKFRPSPPWYEGSRRIHSGRGEIFLGRAVSAWKIAPSPPFVVPFPPWSGRTRRLRLDSWLRRLRLGLESCAVSTLVWAISTLIAKVAPYPPRSQGTFSWSRRLRLVLENDAVWYGMYPPRAQG